MMSAGQCRVLLVGWDAAEWRIVSQLAGRGLMPNVAGLLARGVGGTVAAREPLLSPTCWTSIVTGAPATRHGVVTASEVAAEGGTIQPVGRTACAAPPLWSIAAAAGVPCHVINFPATHPAEATGGVCVSNHFPLRATPDLAAAVNPSELTRTLASMRVSPGEIDIATILSFVPDAAKVNRRIDDHLEWLTGALAHAATVHAIATWAMEKIPWRLTAICYTALHQLSHGFMAFHPPARKCVDPAKFEIYQHVITAAYRFHDMMLGRLLQLAGQDANVILVSDHGFHSDRLRPQINGAATKMMLAWHRPRALLVAAGPGISSDRSLAGMTVFDVAPMVLGLLDVKMPTESKVYETSAAQDSHPDDSTVRQLKDLGYTEREDPHEQLARRQIGQERDFYMAVAWLDAGRPERALSTLQRLAEQCPDRSEYQVGLAHAYAGLRRIDDCRRVAAKLAERFPDAPQALVAAALLAIAGRRAELALQLLRRAQATDVPDRPGMPDIYAASGQAYLRLRHLTEARRAFATAIELDGDCAQAHAGLAAVLVAEGDPAAAAESARRAIALQPDAASHHYRLAMALENLGAYAKARNALLTALKLGPNSPAYLRKLSMISQWLGDERAAREYDLQAHLALVNRRIMRAPLPHA
jgi:predicted AlkP superfamily phosphohydrolase/phosphomutase/Flp pilus assembly protein TadD